MTLFRTTGLLIALLLLGYIGWMNYDLLREAYGAGPPYYGRTVNMDKWHDPLPGLLLIDALGALIGTAAVRMYRLRKSEAEGFTEEEAEAEGGEA